MAPSALCVTPLWYSEGWWQNWSSRRLQPQPRCRCFHWGPNKQLCWQKAFSKGELEQQRDRKAGLCLFCSMLYSHHPRRAGAQILVGKYQEVTYFYSWHIFEPTRENFRCTSGSWYFAGARVLPVGVEERWFGIFGLLLSQVMSPGDIYLINKAILFKRYIRVFAVSPGHRHNINYHFIGQAEMYQFMRHLISRFWMMEF